jgi:ParB family chromosome partitioning protein
MKASEQETNELFGATLDAQLAFNTEIAFGGSKRLMSDIKAKSRDLYQVPFELIREIPNFNVRVHDEAYDQHIDYLAQSMFENGFYQDKPIAGYVANVDGKDVIYVTDGYSRLKAIPRANKLGASITTVPMVFKSAATSLEDLTVALVTSNEGKPLTPFEKGIVCKRLEGYGMERTDIAKRLKISAVYVGQLLTLMGAPNEIRKLVQAGKLSAENALAAMKKHGTKAVEVLQTASAQAAASGQKRITEKSLPGAKFAKAIKKQAPVMAETLRSVKADPGFSSLSPELREKLEALLGTLDASAVAAPDAQEAPEAAAAQDETTTATAE